MKRVSAITMGLLIVGFGLVALQNSSPAFAQAPAGWTTLFDGKGLTAFDVVGNANWQIVEGAVQANTGTGFLVSKNSYTDFEMYAEFWVDADANSGIFIRCENPKEISAANAYEVNIFDKRPDQAYRTGAIVDVAKPSSMINTGGKWNTYEIRAQGPRMIVTLNGTRTVDVQHSGHARGPVALQYGAGVVKFRNVRIRPL
jgi:hypothetical protein